MTANGPALLHFAMIISMQKLIKVMKSNAGFVRV